MNYFQINIVLERQEADVADGNATARKLIGMIERKTLKQTVMTQVYGVTQYGARAQIKGNKVVRFFTIFEK